MGLLMQRPLAQTHLSSLQPLLQQVWVFEQFSDVADTGLAGQRV